MSTPVRGPEGAEGPDRSGRLWTLFDRAADLPQGERRAMLDAACADDPALRSQIERLLVADARLRAEENAFLISPLIRSAPKPSAGADAPEETPAWGCMSPAAGAASRIGSYRIVRLLGEGGMGTVYEAEQENPRRPVALKVVRPGLTSPSLLNRSAHEARILGLLHHPGIAQVYEAGVADNGRPFFAMEFIRGRPLNEYARLRSLTPAGCLDLLARVCDAVQHAHDQGVVHRDLKPANILVEESGRPRVLDFGVARVIDPDRITAAELTQTGQVLGTPSYMSPEQLAADPSAVDHRADVYALGVILFEVLARRLPYQVEHQPLAQVARRILEEDPPRLGSIDPSLRGDVETIVARAMEKDPARRYASAADLAADVRRWLADEPIHARPASVLHMLGKFARRQKALVGGVVATLAALSLGLVGTTLFALAEARQRSLSELNAQKASDERREATFQAYRARIAAASAALLAHDVEDAARQLAAAPEGLRNWEWRHLHGRLDDSSAVIPLSAEANGYLFTDADRVRVAVWSGTDLSLSDLDGGAPRTLKLGVRCGSVDSVAQTSRGLRVAAWVGNTSFELRDSAGRVLRRVETTEGERPTPVVVSPDGTLLACHRSVGQRSYVAVFDANSGRRTAVCVGHEQEVWGLAFSPDGKRLASAGEDRTARLWDSATGAPLVTCRGHAGKVLGVAFSPDGGRLSTCSSDGTVRQWDGATGAEVEPPYDRHIGELAAVAYSPDGRRIASAGTDRTVRVWRAAGRQDLAVLHGHDRDVTGLAFAPDGKRLASLSCSVASRWQGDGTVRVWDIDSRTVLPILEGHGRAVYPTTFSPDGRWLASGGWDRDVRLWDAATGAPCAVWPHPGIVPSLAYGPDGTWLVTGNYGDDRLRIWDVAKGRVRMEIGLAAGVFRFVTVRSDGARAAATTYDGRAYHFQVLDLSSGTRLFSFDGQALAYSPDGRWLAGADADDKTVLLFDAQTHEIVGRFGGHAGFVHGGVFAPDGRRLATYGRDFTVRIWDLPGGSCQVLRGHTDMVFAAAFHPDGTRLATGGRNQVIWLWDLKRGEDVARLRGHTSYVWSLAFSPDGTSLVSGSGDATVRLWDTAPLKKRYRACRDVEAAQEEAVRLVGRLLAELREPARVVARLSADESLSDSLRHAALIEVMRREGK